MLEPVFFCMFRNNSKNLCFVWVEGKKEREKERKRKFKDFKTYFRELALLVELPETFTELR